MATDSLPGAILAAFQGDGGCTSAFPGGIWHGEAEEGTALPYCELDTPEGTIQQTSGKPYIETAPVTFTAWAAGLTAAEACGSALLALFNRRGAVTFATATMLAMLQRSPNAPKPSDRHNEAGDVVYRLDIRYEATVQRSKP
jgi:hypothetical protein